MKRAPETGLSHEEAVTRHAIRSAWQRRGVVLSRAQYLDLCAACFLGQPYARDDRGAPVFQVKLNGIEAYAVWSVEVARIATFLPCKEWIGNRWDGRKFVQRRVA